MSLKYIDELISELECIKKDLVNKVSEVERTIILLR